MMMMKQAFSLIIFLMLLLSAQAQGDSTNVAHRSNLKTLVNEESVITIFPVPVRENVVNIRSVKEISSIKITNIIGQDIFRADYNNSQTIVKIILDNPKRGVYLVTIGFADKTRIVKKIMIEGII